MTLKGYGGRRMHCELHSLKRKYVESLFRIETLDFIEGGLKGPFSVGQLSFLVELFRPQVSWNSNAQEKRSQTQTGFMEADLVTNESRQTL